MFKLRFMHELKTTFNYWRSMVDVVTLIYITVPTILLGFYFIRETVLQAEYGLLMDFPPAIILASLLILSCSLSHRYFADFADRLFFIQQKKAFMRMKLLAFLFSYIKNVGILTIPFLLLLPYFYVVKSFAIWQVVQSALILLLMLLLNEWLKYSSKKWLQVVVIIFLILFLTSTVFTVFEIVYVTVFAYIGCFVFFIKRFILTTRYFEKQASFEFDASTKLQSMMIKMNPQFAGIKPEVFKRRKPYMWKKLYAKTTEGAIMELVLKTFWRRKKLSQLYGQFIMVLIVLLIILPIWMNVILVLIFYIGMKQYVEGITFEIKDSQFAKLFQLTSNQWQKAIRKISFLLVGGWVVLFSLIILSKILL